VQQFSNFELIAELKSFLNYKYTNERKKYGAKKECPY
jgi:hypothetical protein